MWSGLLNFTAALLLTLAWARADLVVTQEVETVGGARGTMTIQIKGTKIRSDVAEPISTIFDSASGETLYLHHKAHTFSRLTAEQSKTLADKLRQAGPAPGTGVLSPGNQRKEINGFQTDLFLWNAGTLKLRFWVARDLPAGVAVQHQLDKLQSSGLAQATAALMPTHEQLPGLRVRTELDAGLQKVAYTIVSIKDEPVPEERFSVPKDYRETPFAVTGAEPEK